MQYINYVQIMWQYYISEQGKITDTKQTIEISVHQMKTKLRLVWYVLFSVNFSVTNPQMNKIIVTYVI